MSSSNPLQILGAPNQNVPDDWLSGGDVRPKDSACLDLYVPESKSGRFSQVSPKHSGMVSYAGNLLFIIKLSNLMEKYGYPIWD